MDTVKLQSQILTPASGDAYTTALRRNSELSTLPAKFVVQPVVYEDIPPVLAAALSETPPLEIAVKGGGAHSATWASSNGGVVIDLSKLNKATLSQDRKSIVVQGGALWGDVYEVASRENVDVVGGSLWFVGVGGFTLGGGYGPSSGEHGLAIDNLLSAKIVLADGRIVTASADEEPDLFWAIRGGGGQFGIVVEFTFKVHPPPGPIGCGLIAYPGTELDSVLKVIKEWQATQTPSERFTMNFSRPAPHFKPSIVILPTVLHDTPDGTRTSTALAPFLTTLKPVLSKIGPAPDMLAVSHSADAALAAAPRRLVIRGTIFRNFYPELLTEVFQRWVAFTDANEDAKASAILWDMTHPAALAAVPVDATALRVRTPHYWMAVQGRTTSSSDASVKSIEDFTADVVRLVRKKNAELSGEDLGWFLNLCRGNEKPEDVFGTNLKRLRKVKAAYDPKKVWSKGVVIEPSF